MLKKLTIFLICALTIAFNVQAQTFEAKVNRTEIPEGETFLLTLDLSGVQTNKTPDLGVLDKDFIIYSVSNAYTTKVINNDISQTRQWNLVLMPKNTGALQIPSIKLDQYQTEPITVTVRKAGETLSPQQQGQQGQPRFKIDGKIDNGNPYVQQQINYTLTIYDTGGLQGEEPVFLAGGNDEWIIKNLGEPQVKTKVINGRNIREIKFFYALFPQKSGELTVPEVRFNGFYLTRDSRRDPFGGLFGDDMFIAGFGMTDMFATRNPVVLNTKPIKVTVLPAPAQNGGKWWLPATDVELYAQFEPANPQFKTGEAVSRTIYLKAVGVIDTQLPEINFGEVPGLKQYPEKPETQMKVENGQVVSLEKISNVYIPSSEGDMTLPEISVDWFNVKTNKMETAVLPSLNIKVRAGQSLPEEKRQTQQTAAPDSSTLPIAVDVRTEETNSLPQQNIYLLLGGAFILGIAVSYALMRLFSNKKDGKIRNYKKYIIEKAREKDLRALRDAVLAWAAEKYQRPDINSLKEVEELTNVPEFECELEKLTEALYARDNKDWKSGSFIKVFEKVYAKKYKRKDDNEPLPKLYK